MIVLSRIDSRLIHGQVIEAWLPHLRVMRVVVADVGAATDPLTQAVIGIAVPPTVRVELTAPGAVDYAKLASDGVRTLVLFRDVAAAVAARSRGLPDGPLVLGNVHAGPGRTPESSSVYLTDEERAQLRGLCASGMDVMVQSVPTERPTRLTAA